LAKTSFSQRAVLGFCFSILAGGPIPRLLRSDPVHTAPGEGEKECVGAGGAATSLEEFAMLLIHAYLRF
jgi:hypothetical protein